MEKGENIISTALVAVVVITVLVVHRRCGPAGLTDVASSAEEFILTTTGIRGQVPDLAGYERVGVFPLGSYRAALYRKSPAPLVFTPGRLVIYNANNQPMFRLDTLEGSREPWTTFYDFAGQRGLTVPGSRTRPVYTRDLNGMGEPEAVIGQYSGGGHCCTTATVLELTKDAVRVIGRVDRLSGSPFEGLELRQFDRTPAYELLAHREYRTLCGSPREAGDMVSLYLYADGVYTDQSASFPGFRESIYRQNLAQWAKENLRSLQLLQTLTLDLVSLGERDQAKRFFAMNLRLFLPQIQRNGVDPNTCLEDMEGMIDRLAINIP